MNKMNVEWNWLLRVSDMFDEIGKDDVGICWYLVTPKIVECKYKGQMSTKPNENSSNSLQSATKT